LSLYTHEDR